MVIDNVTNVETNAGDQNITLLAVTGHENLWRSLVIFMPTCARLDIAATQ